MSPTAARPTTASSPTVALRGAVPFIRNEVVARTWRRTSGGTCGNNCHVDKRYLDLIPSVSESVLKSNH